MRNPTNKAVTIALHWDDERADITFGTAGTCDQYAQTLTASRHHQAVLVIQRPLKATPSAADIDMHSITMPDDADITGVQTASDLIQRVRDLLQDESAITPEAAVHLEYMFDVLRDHTVPLAMYRDAVASFTYLLEAAILLREAQRGHGRQLQRDAERSFDTLLKKLKRTDGDTLTHAA